MVSVLYDVSLMLCNIILIEVVEAYLERVVLEQFHHIATIRDEK
jgi:hypothetical protein